MTKLMPLIRRSSFWLVIFLLAGLILGLIFFQDFGVSFDEPGIYNFAPVVLDMYSTAFDPPERPVFQRESFLHRNRIPTDLFNYGPFYFIAVELFVRGLQGLGIQTPYWDLWHFAYFLTFEAGLVVFYLLCRRWLSGWASLGATLLFATQPLIVGHVFMNTKDPPFMLFFLAAVWSGLLMVDNIRLGPPVQEAHQPGNLVNTARTEWQSLSQKETAKARRDLLMIGITLLVVMIALPLLAVIVDRSVSVVYFAPAESLPGRLLRMISSNPENIPLQNFIAKGQAWLYRLRYAIIILLILVAAWKVYKLLPGFGRQSIRTISIPLRIFLQCLINPYVLLAGVLLGFTLSIRMFAPLAGGLVLVYLLWKMRWRAILPAIAYGCIALLTSYLTWPYLWGEPIKRIIKSWQVMNAFSIPGSWSSLPSLLAIQYTEPAVILAIAGTIIAVVEFFRGKRSGLFFLFLGWSVLPMAVLMWKEANLYNNFRQVLFIIPPFFMIAGLAIEWIIQYFHRPLLTGVLFLLILLPGVVAIVRLHPFTYVYYNQFIGGVENAARRYDTDYWGVSAKETAEYLNQAAPENSSILACAPVNTLELYLRDDLRITACEQVSDMSTGFDYLVVSGRGYIDRQYDPQAKVVYSISRENVVLALVKSLKGSAE